MSSTLSVYSNAAGVYSRNFNSIELELCSSSRPPANPLESPTMCLLFWLVYVRLFVFSMFLRLHGQICSRFMHYSTVAGAGRRGLLLLNPWIG